MGGRWRVAAAGTALMACLGTVYGWSLFAQPLAAAFGWSAARTTAPFAAAIFFLGVGAIAGGRWQDRAGPGPVALTGAILWGLGNLLAGLGTAALGWAWLVATYGVVGGLGLGLGYVTPVAAVTKWFPDRRGLGSGLVVMGFGLGAFFYALVLRSLPGLSSGSPGGLLGIFSASGLLFLAVGGGAAALVRNPPAGPALASARAAPQEAAPASGLDLPPREALRRPQFWSLWAMLFLNVTAGILFISNAVPIMRELTGAEPATAAAIYGAIALFNGLGRFFWGAVSDRIGRNRAYLLIYATQAAIFSIAGGVHSLAAVTILFAVVLLDYGGGFGTMPSLTADYFGTRWLGVNYGWILTAWGAAGIAGPIFVALVKDRTGTFSGALPVIAVVLGLSTILPIVTRRPGVTSPAGRGRVAARS
jgi:OFA family oxalate/formate antiporter-like MFS transporter